jgi:hypothetical protein
MRNRPAQGAGRLTGVRLGVLPIEDRVHVRPLEVGDRTVLVVGGCALLEKEVQSGTDVDEGDEEEDEAPCRVAAIVQPADHRAEADDKERDVEDDEDEERCQIRVRYRGSKVEHHAQDHADQKEAEVRSAVESSLEQLPEMERLGAQRLT